MRLIAVVAVLCGHCLPLAAQDQIVINDSRRDWRQHTFVPVLQPTTWGEYAEGDLYLRYEVIDKPTDIEIMPMICLWQGNFGDPDFRETCTQMGALVTFTDEGTYFQKFNGPATRTQWRAVHGASYKHDEPTDRIMHQWWVQKDGQNVVLRGDFGETYDFGDGVEEHIPIDFRTTMILVKPGQSFTPPADWIGCPWGCAESIERADLVIVGDSPTWTMEPSRRLTVGPANFEGRAGVSLDGSGSWLLSMVPEEPVPLFRFAAVSLMVHPAAASVADDQDAALWMGKIDLLQQIDLRRQEWQRVTVPIVDLRMDQITPQQPLKFAGNLLGTFYFGDVRLLGEQPATAVTEEMQAARSSVFALSQNYPNPFNPATTIRFELPRSAQVDLGLFNLAGQRVATLVSGLRDAGSYRVGWDGRNAAGQQLAAGMYIYRLRAGSQVQTQKMMLLR